MAELRVSRPDELDWINERYTDLGFEASDERVELHVVAEVGTDRDRAGLGRLVRIDDDAVELGGMWVDPAHRGRGLAREIVLELMQRAGDRTVWCIPFRDLVPFYESCGLHAPADDVEIPAAVRARATSCRNTFAQRVSLLVASSPC